ncbi:MAG: phosphopyruvate hydratase [Patescibacteria group bacterium]
MAKIQDIVGREILDSRGNPTVACKVTLDDGSFATGYVASGASTGQFEALELRDGDESRYLGKGVLKAVSNVNELIKPALVGLESASLSVIDKKMIELDGTKNKSKLGANAMLSVSLASAKAIAKSEKKELFEYLAPLMNEKVDDLTIPIPFLNILNGGKHAIGSTDFQEFMIVPIKFEKFRRAIQAGTEIYHALGKILDERSYQPLVGDEGGFAPSLFSNEQAMELLMMAIKDAGYHAGEDVFIALDPAASRFYSGDIYQLHRENRSLISSEMIEFYETWIEKFPIISIEDALDENDWDNWGELTKRIGDKIELIGDDLYATNKDLLKKGIEHNASTGILIKPNQIGTLSETIETIEMAKQAGFKIIISHRSGETEDAFIADLSVAANCGAIKSGAPARSERTAKYNRLMEIESILGDKAKYAEWDLLESAKQEVAF